MMRIHAPRADFLQLKRSQKPDRDDGLTRR